MTPEEQAVSRLGVSPFKLDDDSLAALERYFHQLREIDRQVSRSSPNEFYQSQWGILGIVGRSYQLTLCCIDQIASENWNGFYVAARGLVETLCSVVWASQATQRLVALVEHQPLGIGKILNAGYRQYPELQQTHQELSSVVHPNRDSYLLGFRPVEQRAEFGIWSPFTLTFSDQYAARKLSLLIDISSKVTDELSGLLSQNPDAAKQGKVMTRIIRLQDPELIGSGLALLREVRSRKREARIRPSPQDAALPLRPRLRGNGIPDHGGQRPQHHDHRQHCVSVSGPRPRASGRTLNYRSTY